MASRQVRQLEGDSDFQIEPPGQSLPSQKRVHSQLSSTGIDMQCHLSWNVLYRVSMTLMVLYCTVVCTYLLHQSRVTQDDGFAESTSGLSLLPIFISVISSWRIDTEYVTTEAAQSITSPMQLGCDCNNVTNSNALEMDDVIKLQQQLDSLNRSIFLMQDSSELTHSLETLNDTVSNILIDIDSMKASVSSLYVQNSEWEQQLTVLKNQYLILNASAENRASTLSRNLDTVKTLNLTVHDLITETTALRMSLLSLTNHSLGLSTSMVPGWPDAIACTGTVSGHTVYYLVHAPESNNGGYYYRMINFTGDEVTQRNFVYDEDGTFRWKLGNIGDSDCDNKSIQQLYADGLAFNFVTSNSSITF